jgi:hypothetical protein
MLVGIMSDSHDRPENMRLAIKKMKEMGAEVIIHCGDMIAPFMLEVLEEFQGPVHTVFGYPDMSQHAALVILRRIKHMRHVSFHGDLGELDIGKRKVAFVHDFKWVEPLASTLKYDAVFYGHNHEANKSKAGDTLLLNPGEIAGIKNPPSFAIYDTDKNDAEIIQL